MLHIYIYSIDLIFFSVQDKSVAVTESKSEEEEMVNFKVIYNKKKFDVSFGLDKDVKSLKKHMEEQTGEF